MTLLEEFENRHTQKPTDTAKIILFGVLDDLTDRRGIRQEWDGIDDEIKEEILETNLEIVAKNLF